MKKLYNSPSIKLNNFMLQDVLKTSDVNVVEALESLLGWGENGWKL